MFNLPSRLLLEKQASILLSIYKSQQFGIFFMVCFVDSTKKLEWNKATAAGDQRFWVHEVFRYLWDYKIHNDCKLNTCFVEFTYTLTSIIYNHIIFYNLVGIQIPPVPDFVHKDFESVWILKGCYWSLEARTSKFGIRGLNWIHPKKVLTLSQFTISHKALLVTERTLFHMIFKLKCSLVWVKTHLFGAFIDFIV